MKEFKPYHVALFLAAVFLTLLPLVYFAPEDGFVFAGTKIQFLTKEEFLHPKVQQKKDISKLVAMVDTSNLNSNEIDTLHPFPDVQLSANPKKHRNGSRGNLGAPTAGMLKEESSSTLLLSEGARKNLIRFFEKMDKVASEKTKIHILHYGDSQIEGDRMTSYIRQRIQNQFGGNGPGLIPAMNVYPTVSFKQSYSDNFMRYTCFGGSKLKSRKYGVMGSAARFTAEYADSMGSLSSQAVQEAWIEIEPSFKAQSRARSYNNVKFFYTACLKPCLLKVYQNDVLIHEDSLINDGKYHQHELNFSTTPGKLKYVFASKLSPTFCGFSLEGDYGIQVDNIGMRGSSGTFFGMIDNSLLANMYNDLNSELILLQFGGNSVPFFKDSSSVRKYASYFQGQIRTVQKMHPSAAIIVIGPSDMSHMKDGIYETYKFLPYCVQQMKKAASNENAAYWDLFKAMGGSNSMPAWVESGYAGKDYIHFSNKGASIASQLFYDALESEFAKWKIQNVP